MDRGRILVCGAGIAGLTFAIEAKRRGFEPLVIERESGPRREGYMMDFFGTGWDVAERMGLVERLRAVRYPIDALEFVDGAGKPYARLPIARLRRALGGRYVYLRRQDLERILAERAAETGVAIRYGCSLAALDDRSDAIEARFHDGGAATFALAVGADGVHSRLRELVFGPEWRFARFLGLHVAAFHRVSGGIAPARAARIYEETDRLAMIYPLDERHIDATFVLRDPAPAIPKAERADFLRKHLQGAGWIMETVMKGRDEDAPLFLDSVTQIVMPAWHRGRVVLIGDACGCLTLLAGQGSHMAMAGGYGLAQMLAREGDHAAAFAAYAALLAPHVARKQRDAARLARIFVPSARSHPALRRLAIRLVIGGPLIGLGLSRIGARSVLPRRL